MTRFIVSNGAYDCTSRVGICIHPQTNRDHLASGSARGSPSGGGRRGLPCNDSAQQLVAQWAVERVSTPRATINRSSASTVALSARFSSAVVSVVERAQRARVHASPSKSTPRRAGEDRVAALPERARHRLISVERNDRHRNGWDRLRLGGTRGHQHTQKGPAKRRFAQESSEQLKDWLLPSASRRSKRCR